MGTRLDEQATIEQARHQAIRRAVNAQRRIAKAQRERDAAVLMAIELGATQQAVATGLGMSHTGVQYIVKASKQ